MAKPGQRMKQLLIILFAALASATPVVEADGVQPVHPTTVQVASVSDYCARFAQAYAVRNAFQVAPDPIEIEPKPALWHWLSNVFQPPGSRFTGSYRCRFVTLAANAGRRIVSVNLYLAETRAFAAHTHWEDLQTVPIEWLVDDTNGHAGYGVFKYLRSD